MQLICKRRDTQDDDDDDLLLLDPNHKTYNKVNHAEKVHPKNMNGMDDGKKLFFEGSSD